MLYATVQRPPEPGDLGDPAKGPSPALVRQIRCREALTPLRRGFALQFADCGVDDRRGRARCCVDMSEEEPKV